MKGTVVGCLEVPVIEELDVCAVTCTETVHMSKMIENTPSSVPEVCSVVVSRGRTLLRLTCSPSYVSSKIVPIQLAPTTMSPTLLRLEIMSDHKTNIEAKRGLPICSC